MKQRKFTEEQKKAVLQDYKTLGSRATMAKYKLSSSVIHGWRKKAGELSTQKKVAPAQSSATSDVKSAIVYLSHARNEINSALRKGVIRNMDKAHLYTLLALQALTGE